MTDTISLDRRNNRDAERDLIGAVLMAPRAIHDAEHIAPEDYWDPRHEALWRMILDEHRAGRPADPILLSEGLRRGEGANGLGPEYLAEIIGGNTQPAYKVPYLANLVQQTAQARRIQELGQRLQAEASAAPLAEVSELADKARADLDRVAEQSAGVEIRTIADAFEDALAEWSNPTDREVYETGWPEVDQALNGGWKPGQVTIVGARPAVGKSLVAGCAAVAAHTYGVGFFSLEMTERELLARMVAAEQGIALGRLESGELSERDWERIGRMRADLSQWRVFIEAKPRRSAAQIKATIRSWQRRAPVPLVIVDYLQLMSPADTREQRERQVSRLAEDCKVIAKELGVHMLVLAQVNRGSTAREDKRPTMSDLRESGGIEANADNIILLHRPEEDETTIEFIFAKNRHGATGTIELIWRPTVASVNSGGDVDGHAYRFGM